MKRFSSLIILVFISQSAFAQLNVWRWQNPAAEGTSLHAVQMINLNTIFACGNYGAVVKTIDGGITWSIDYGDVWGTTPNGPYRGNYYGLSFLDSNYGMICGDSGHIIKTSDGGSTWTWLVTNTRAKLNSIVVIDANTAIVVGKEGTILRTLDGGTTWRPIPFEIVVDFTSIRKLRPDFLTVTGYNGALYKSTDRGLSWNNIPLQTDTTVYGNNINGQVFLDGFNATVIGQNGVILHTINGGFLWKRQFLNDTIFLTAALNFIDGKDPNILAMVGDYGTLLHTINGGTTWNRVNLGITDSLRGLSYYDKYNATAVGKGGIILRTSDGGATWRFLPSRPLTDKLNGIAFNKGDTSLGIAVGDYGAIMRTSNGGAHWDLIGSGTTDELKAVAFEYASVIFAVGQHGTILKSTNSGVSWNKQNSGTTKFLKSISFPTPNSGWVVGDSGTVLSTADGGVTWTRHLFSKRRTFNCVSFPDAQHGYMGSDHGLYTTIDGGATWSEPEDNTYYLYCNGVSSPSANVVCLIANTCDNQVGGGAVGVSIYTSHDGAKTWKDTSFKFGLSPGPLKIQGGICSSVYFTDDLHGTIAGGNIHGPTSGGHIFHTVDGGKTWKETKSLTEVWGVTPNFLYGVCFGSNKAGTAVGWRGNIMRITTDE